MTSIQFQPLVPWALWLVLAVSGGIVLVWYAAHRPSVMPRGRWLMALALSCLGLCLVLVILLSPTVVFPIPPPVGKPLLTILVDRSASMRIKDQPDAASRFKRAAEVTARIERELRSSFEVQIRTFAETTTSVSADQLTATNPDGQTTDLATAVSQSLDGSRAVGQAVLMLSDGIDNAGGGSRRVLDVAQASYAMSIPIFSSVIGEATSVEDLDLSLIRQQELAFVDQRTPVRVVVRQRGHLTGEVEVELINEAGQAIDQQPIKLPTNGEGTATFHVSQPRAGLHRYQLRTSPDPREATVSNNASTFLLRTVDQPIRVLLLEGKPYWDAKFLMRTLAQDQALEVDAVIRVTEGRWLRRTLRQTKTADDAVTDGALADESELRKTKREVTTEILHDQAAIMANPQKLAEYQVLVLGRDAEAFLSDDVLQQLRTWISRDGGSLVCFRGPPVSKLNQQLSRLMPVRWSPMAESRFRVHVTSRGQDLPWMSAAPGYPDALETLPSLALAAKPQQPTPLAVVVADAPGRAEPVVSYQPYGCGRVVVIEGAGMWRWAFLAPGHQQPEPFYDALWQGLMRWLVAGGGLAPGQKLALRTDKVSFFTEELAAATLLVREEAIQGDLPRVELEQNATVLGSFAPASLGEEPGVYRVSFGRLAPGSYRASVAGDLRNETESAVAFDVRPNFTEQLDTEARPDLLTLLADKSGGAVIPEVTAAELARRFREHLAHHRPLQLRETTIWDRWWMLVLIVGLWSSTWTLRRRWGLI